MTKLKLEIIEKAIDLILTSSVRTSDGAIHYYSCYALTQAQGEYLYDDKGYCEHKDPYLLAYTAFTAKRVGCVVDSLGTGFVSGVAMWPNWWCNNAYAYRTERLENLRAFKEAVERGSIE